jgi:hypothetical protein
LSKDDDNETACYKAARGVNVEIFVEVWDWGKKLQLKSEVLRNEVLLSKDKY